MEFSTDYNMQNPTITKRIDLLAEVHRPPMRIERVTQEYYDTIPNPDPLTCYIIINARDKRVYYGKLLVLPDKIKTRYFIGQEKMNEWTVYVHENDMLLKICTYDNPEAALEALRAYNNVGSHYQINVHIYNTLVAYIKNETSLNSTLIGLISLFGYKENPLLQDLIQLTIAAGFDDVTNRKTFSKPNKDVFDRYSAIRKNYLIPLYVKLYDLVRDHDFFIKEREMKFEDRYDLSEVIEDILKIMTRLT